MLVSTPNSVWAGVPHMPALSWEPSWYWNVQGHLHRVCGALPGVASVAGCWLGSSYYGVVRVLTW